MAKPIMAKTALEIPAPLGHHRLVMACTHTAEVPAAVVAGIRPLGRGTTTNFPKGRCRLRQRLASHRIGRGERIRTSDSCVPNAVLYQAELHPEAINRLAGCA